MIGTDLQNYWVAAPDQHVEDFQLAGQFLVPVSAKAVGMNSCLGKKCHEFS